MLHPPHWCVNFNDHSLISQYDFQRDLHDFLYAQLLYVLHVEMWNIEFL